MLPFTINVLKFIKFEYFIKMYFLLNKIRSNGIRMLDKKTWVVKSDTLVLHNVQLSYSNHLYIKVFFQVTTTLNKWCLAGHVII